MRRDVLLLTAGRLAQAVIAIASLRLMTSILSPAQVGSMFLLLSLASWVGLFLINPVGMFINRNLHSWHKRNVLLEKLGFYNLYLLAVSLLVIPVVIGSKLFWGLGSDIPLPHFLISVSLYIFAYTLSQTPVQVLNMLGYRKAFVGLSVLTIASGLLFSVCISSFFSRTSYSWIYGQILSFFMVYIPAVLQLRRLEPGASVVPEFNFEKLSGAGLNVLWRFAAPFSIAMFFMWVQTQSYRVIVERFAGPEFLGYLAVGLSIATGLAGITESLVQQLYFPDFYRKLHGATPAERASALSDLAEKAIPVYIVLSLFTLFMSQHLTRLLVSAKFQAVWKFAAIGALIELFRMIANIFTSAAHSEMKTSSLIWPYFWGGLFTSLAVLSVCLARLPAISVPLCMAAGGLLTMMLIKKRMGQLAAFKIDKATISKSIFLCAGFVPPFLLTRQEPLWRAVLIVAIFGLYFFFVQWRILLAGKEFDGKSGFSPKFLLKKVFNAIPLLDGAYAAFKGRQQERLAALDLAYYAEKARGAGLGPRNDAALASALHERLVDRNICISQAEKKDLHIFLTYPRNNWEAVLEKALESFGRVTVYEWRSRGYNDAAPDWPLRRDEMNADMFNVFMRANAEKKIDAVVGYLTGSNTAPEVLAKMGQCGAVVFNFCWDDKLHFRDYRLAGRYAGPCVLAKEIDLNLTCAPDSVLKYMVEGGLAMFWPEAAHQDIHKHYKLPFEFDVSFVGQKYGWRPKFIQNLEKAGIKVACFGKGWKNGPLSDEEMIKLYSRSRINLGFSGIGYSRRLMGLKGRDFEVPMSGGLYLTQDNPELALVYNVGEEILTYHAENDCADTIKTLLANPARMERIRKAGHARASKDHTWERRFEELFRFSGMIK